MKNLKSVPINYKGIWFEVFYYDIDEIMDIELAGYPDLEVNSLLKDEHEQAIYALAKIEIEKE